MTVSNYGNTSIMVCAMTFLCLYASARQTQPDTLAWRALQDVVVTGQYAPQSVKRSAYRVRTINQERIAMRGATDIADVLNNELGVRFQTDYTLGESDMRIMGLGGTRVKILLDGVSGILEQLYRFRYLAAGESAGRAGHFLAGGLLNDYHDFIDMAFDGVRQVTT